MGSEVNFLSKLVKYSTVFQRILYNDFVKGLVTNLKEKIPAQNFLNKLILLS